MRFSVNNNGRRPLSIPPPFLPGPEFSGASRKMGKNGPFLGRFPKSYGLGFEIISVHTRADAIADGVLRDVSDTAKERGFRIPFAVTDTIWAEWIEASPGLQKYGQSVIPVF